MPGHGLGSGVTGRSELKATGTPARQPAQPLPCEAPPPAARAHRPALGASVDEPLDGAGPHHRAAEAGPNANACGRLEQLPGEELVDPHLEPAFARKPLVGA